MGQVRGARARRAQRLGWDADRASQCSMHARSDRAARSRVGDRRGPCPPPRSGCGCFARLANRTPRDDGQRERAVALRVIAVCCVPSSSHPHQRIRARTGCGQSSSPASHSGGRPGEPGQASQSPSTSSHPPRAHPHPHPCRVRLRSPSHASAMPPSPPRIRSGRITLPAPGRQQWNPSPNGRRTVFLALPCGVHAPAVASCPGRREPTSEAASASRPPSPNRTLAHPPRRGAAEEQNASEGRYAGRKASHDVRPVRVHSAEASPTANRRGGNPLRRPILIKPCREIPALRKHASSASLRSLPPDPSSPSSQRTRLPETERPYPRSPARSTINAHAYSLLVRSPFRHPSASHPARVTTPIPGVDMHARTHPLGH